LTTKHPSGQLPQRGNEIEKEHSGSRTWRRKDLRKHWRKDHPQLKVRTWNTLWMIAILSVEKRASTKGKKMKNLYRFYWGEMGGKAAM